MELLYSIPVAIFFVIIFLAATTKNSDKKLPPGPMKVPIIGNLHNMIGALPHQTLRGLSRKYGPLMHLKLGESSTLVVSSGAMAKEFTKTNDLSFAHRPRFLTHEACFGNVSSDISFAPYGEYWRQMRKLCVIELLSHKRVQSFSSIRQEEVGNLVRSIQSSSSDGPINLSERLLGLTSTITCRAAFGRKYNAEDAESMVSNISEAIKVAGGFEIADLYPSLKILQVISPSLKKIKKFFREVDSALQKIIDKHVSEEIAGTEEIEDLVDVLLRLQRSGDLEVPITDKGIKAIITDMFAGGTNTSATTVTWAMAEMMKHPRVMAEAQTEIRQVPRGKQVMKVDDIQGLDYLKLVVKETLRLHPPVPLLLPRECRESCVVEGYKIPVKTKVLINAWAIGRDDKYWDDAETFYPERFLNSSSDFMGTSFELIPFGAGRRMCPGVNFALANIMLSLAQLLYHFDWKLPDHMKPESLDMTELFGAAVTRKFDLRLTAIPWVPVEE